MPKPEVGQNLHGFRVDDVHDLPEYNATGIVLTHQATACQVYHVRNDDIDKLFAFGFKTLPTDSTGVAHILEHTVLCGSQSFPVKDPFLLLLKGSMNTFLNAFTFPDKTLYPASSTVEKDFFNLMEVYGDAVFFPLLKPEMFRQEGHRLEIDAQGRLSRTGIVFNEMKGNYSTHDSVAGDWCMRSLFPDTAYAHDSGGDPACIPQLTYQQFLDFHHRYYHPSNTRIFLYGDVDTEACLEFLNRRFLSRFDLLPPQDQLTDPKPFSQAVRLTKTYPAGPDDEAEGKASITMNWLLNPVGQAEQTLALEVLTDILLGSPASPLQRALVDSGLGEDLSGATGLETELSRLTLSLGLRGTAPGREAAIEDLVINTLHELVSKGLDGDLVEGTLRRFEFRGREIKGGGPFGLRLMRRSFRGWLHGLPPQTTLEFAPIMRSLRQKLAAQPRFFENLIQTCLLDNPHRSTVTIIPDGEQNQREQAAERQVLDQLQGQLTSVQIQELKDQQAELERYQSTPDSPADVQKIPFLDQDDIPTQVRQIPADTCLLAVIPQGGHPVDDLRHISGLTHAIHTNGISYLDLCFDLGGLQESELRWMPLFSSLLPGLGLPHKNYELIAKELSLKTGGFSSFIETSLQVRRDERQAPSLQAKLFFRLKCLDGELPQALDLAGQLIIGADFSDHKRIGDLFLEVRNEFRSAILPGGSSFAAMRAERALSPSEAIEECWRGISQQRFLEDLGQDPAAKIAQALGQLRLRIIQLDRLSINLTAAKDSLETGLQIIGDWAKCLPLTRTAEPGSSIQSRSYADGASPVKVEPLPTEAITLPSKVAFVATAMRASLINGPRYSHEVLLAHLLRTGYLWEAVRMKGGAYGANAGNDGLSGIFTFSSYRDPNIVKTMETWGQALAHFADQPLGQSDLLLAKIGCVAKEIRPLAPAEAALVSFRRWVYGISDDLRQKKRDEMLATQAIDLANAAKNLLTSLQNSHSVVIADPEMVDKEESAHPNFRPARLQLSV